MEETLWKLLVRGGAELIMESKTAFFALVLIGVIACVLDLLGVGLFGLFYLGVSWIITGIFYALAKREISEGGFIAALIFGLLGAIAWIVLNRDRTQSERRILYSANRQAYYRKFAKEKYKCRNCFWFGKPGCERKEEFLNAKPCEEFRT